MSIYTSKSIGELIKDNEYAGRGILVGKSEDGSKAAFAYFIMGRSENSRNRVFKEEDNDVVIYPFDESKVEDPSLIIYAPVRTIENTIDGYKVIVTNGDQTDTVQKFVKEGKTFEEALKTRTFEPDAPNFTPRISAMMTFDEGDFSYEMSILKSIDEEGSGCAKYFYSYPSTTGLGHFIHTYEHNGNPLPTFQGEPKRIKIPNSIDEFLEEIWTNLNEENKISIYVRYTDLATRKITNKLINKNI